jgi:hypothetical protein
MCHQKNVFHFFVSAWDFAFHVCQSRKYVLKLISIKNIFYKILDQKENYRDFQNFIELFNTPKK